MRPTVRANSETGSSVARIGAFNIGPVGVGLDTKHSRTDLPVEADHASSKRPGRMDLVAKDGRTEWVGYTHLSPGGTRLVANVHAAPGERRGADKGWRLPVRLGYAGGRDQS